jgi:hypothetical protein
MEEKNEPFHESINESSNEPIDEPFNDVIDHFNKIEGNAGRPSNVNLRKLPKPLKYFGYSIIAFFSISILLLIILNLLN